MNLSLEVERTLLGRTLTLPPERGTSRPAAATIATDAFEFSCAPIATLRAAGRASHFIKDEVGTARLTGRF
jgi:hypothetical protein